MERPRGNTNICLEVLYWCGLVGPGEGSKETVLNLLDLLPHLFSMRRHCREGHYEGQQVDIAGQTTVVNISLKITREVPYDEAVSLVRTLI